MSSSYEQAVRQVPDMDKIMISEGRVSARELGGLYKLAVTRADAVEIASQALNLLARNKRLLTANERETMREMYERLANL